ncbi:MAG: hypothetical protein HRU15_12170 [Planctomycetes bacterium]|nr:hypothetical protein [Planctomycetota bacterium]
MDDTKPFSFKKIFFIGTIACIIALALPIALWSPPWSDNAYYTHNHGEWDSQSHHYSKFTSGKYFECGYSRPSAHEKFVAYTVNKSFSKEADGLWWRSKVNKDGSISKYNIEFSMHAFTTGGKRINRINTGVGTGDTYFKAVVYDKIFNPFTLYYIRWIEWTDK